MALNVKELHPVFTPEKCAASFKAWVAVRRSLETLQEVIGGTSNEIETFMSTVNSEVRGYREMCDAHAVAQLKEAEDQHTNRLAEIAAYQAQFNEV